MKRTNRRTHTAQMELPLRVPEAAGPRSSQTRLLSAASPGGPGGEREWKGPETPKRLREV